MRNTDPGVMDGKVEQGIIQAGSFCFDPQQNFAMLRKFEGIGEKVDYDLTQTRRIAHHNIRHLRSHITDQFDALPIGRERKHPGGFLQAVAQVEFD